MQTHEESLLSNAKIFNNTPVKMRIKLPKLLPTSPFERFLVEGENIENLSPIIIQTQEINAGSRKKGIQKQIELSLQEKCKITNKNNNVKNFKKPKDTKESTTKVVGSANRIEDDEQQNKNKYKDKIGLIEKKVNGEPGVASK